MRRRAMVPTVALPASSKAQVPGSGTAVMGTLPISASSVCAGSG